MIKVHIFVLFLTITCFSSTQRISLIIGNNQGLMSDVPLKYANHDAERIHQVRSELGGIRKNRNYLLTNQSKQKIVKAMHEIKGRIRELKEANLDVLLFFYYSGHSDPDAFHINGEKLLIDSVKAFFRLIDADLRVMFVDACYSGNLLREKGSILSEPIKIKLSDELETKGSAIITSSSPLELSHESENLRGSIFTHHLVTGLRGAADFNKDKHISLMEVYHYTKIRTGQQIFRTKEVRQTPAFDIDLVGKKDISLTNLSEGSSKIYFLDGDGDQYDIVSSTTLDLVAQVTPAKAETVVISLPPDKYLIQKIKGDYLFLKRFDLAWGGDARFSPKKMKAYALESVVSKGRYQWAIQPFAFYIRTKFRKDIPTNSKWLYNPELLFQYRYRKYLFGYSISYGNDNLIGNQINTQRKIWDHMFILGKRFWNHRLITMDVGPNFGGIWMSQLSERKNELKIQGSGYPPLPKVTALVYQTGAHANLSFFLKFGILVNGQVGLAGYFYKENDESKIRLSYPTALSIGGRF